MKRTDKKAFDKANKKDKINTTIISILIGVAVALAILLVYKAQADNRTAFSEEAIEQVESSSTSAEKRIESERSDVESINDSIDEAEGVYNTSDEEGTYYYSSETDTSDTAESTTESTSSDLSTSESKNISEGKPVSAVPESDSYCEHEWKAVPSRDGKYWQFCPKCNGVWVDGILQESGN